jgi:hypothetical protein
MKSKKERKKNNKSEADVPHKMGGVSRSSCCAPSDYYIYFSFLVLCLLHSFSIPSIVAR